MAALSNFTWKSFRTRTFFLSKIKFLFSIEWHWN